MRLIKGLGRRALVLGFLACGFSVLGPIIPGLVSLPEVAGAPIFLGGRIPRMGLLMSQKFRG